MRGTVLGGRPRTLGGLGDLVGLLLGLGSGAVLGPASRLLVYPGSTRLTDIRPNVDRVSQWTTQARLGPTVYVQRGGVVADCLYVRGECHSDRVEPWGLLCSHTGSFDTEGVESKVLWRLGLACGIHRPKHIEARV